jgi:hypothetical protein
LRPRRELPSSPEATSEGGEKLKPKARKSKRRIQILENQVAILSKFEGKARKYKDKYKALKVHL